MIERELEALFTAQNIAALVVTYFVVATLYNFVSFPQPPSTLPWMGYGKGWVNSFRNFTALTKSKEWILEGYQRYSKNNQLFVLPATLGTQAEIIVPKDQMQWMFDQPDTVLSTSEAHYDFLQGAYAFVDPFILKDPYHEHVIHKCLVRNLNAILPELDDEVPYAVEDVFGSDTENWRTVEVLSSFMRMIPGLTNRMIIGKPLCRERSFLDAVLGFTTDCIRTQSSMALVPLVLHPVVGNILSVATHYHYWLSSRWTLPIIKKRIADINKKDAGDPEYKNWKEPSDFITWSYRTAQSEGRRDEMHPTRIAQRIMPINFASIHTTSLTAYEALHSIVGSDPSVLESLREEAHRIFTEEGGWTKQGLNKMHRLDSAIRESQRASPISLTFSHRKVVAKEGVTTPLGVHIPYGTIVSCPWTPLAADKELHDQPEIFDPFRYSRPREEYEAMSEEQKAGVDALKLKQTGLVTTGHSHLPFGHGRHAW